MEKFASGDGTVSRNAIDAFIRVPKKDSIVD
jgi:hypothetical protein